MPAKDETLVSVESGAVVSIWFEISL